MENRIVKICLLVWVCVLLAFAQPALCLIEVGGNEPIGDHGWPVGSLELANLPTRVSWWAGPPFGTGSMYEFQYNCEQTAQFNEALTAFAAIKVNRLELVVHNGPKIDWLGEQKGNRIDWTFTIWNPQDWDRMNNSSRSVYRVGDSGPEKPVPRAKKPVSAPRVDVYIGGNCPIIWKEVKIPKKLIVSDKRPGSVAKKFADKGLIRGKVFDRQTKKPIAAATIVLLNRVEPPEANKDRRATSRTVGYDWQKLMQNTTNANGFCQIENIPLGTYQIHITADGFAPIGLEIYDNRRPEIYEFDAGLLKTGYIKGIAVDTNGKPLAGVAVSAGNFIGVDGTEYPFLSESPVVTNEKGEFEISELPKGFASIRCQGQGLHQTGSIFQMYPIPSDKLKLTMEGTGTVRGKVLTEKGSAPTGQIVLEIETPGEEKIGKWGYSGYLSKDGTFNISGIPPGEYIISARPNPSSASYKPNEQKIIVEPGKTIEIEIRHIE